MRFTPNSAAYPPAFEDTATLSGYLEFEEGWLATEHDMLRHPVPSEWDDPTDQWTALDNRTLLRRMGEDNLEYFSAVRGLLEVGDADHVDGAILFGSINHVMLTGARRRGFDLEKSLADIKRRSAEITAQEAEGAAGDIT